MRDVSRCSGLQRYAEVICREVLGEVLDLLSSIYGINCDLSCRELLNYLSGSTYEDDTVSIDEVFSDELLILHEVAEACILKSWGYEIGLDTVVKAYPRTYSAHLEAMEIELNEALRKGRLEHIENRCRDLHTYLDDPYLPNELATEVQKLIAKCRSKHNYHHE